MSNVVVSTVAADGLAPVGVGTCADAAGFKATALITLAGKQEIAWGNKISNHRLPWATKM